MFYSNNLRLWSLKRSEPMGVSKRPASASCLLPSCSTDCCVVAKCSALLINAVSLLWLFKAPRLSTSFDFRCKSVKPFISHQKIPCNYCSCPCTGWTCLCNVLQRPLFRRLLRILSAASRFLLLDLTATLPRSVHALPAPTSNTTSPTNSSSGATAPKSDERNSPFQVLADGTQDLAALVGSKWTPMLVASCKGSADSATPQSLQLILSNDTASTTIRATFQLARRRCRCSVF